MMIVPLMIVPLLVAHINVTVFRIGSLVLTLLLPSPLIL